MSPPIACEGFLVVTISISIAPMSGCGEAKNAPFAFKRSTRFVTLAL
jgi:hypothetical protein